MLRSSMLCLPMIFMVVLLATLPVSSSQKNVLPQYIPTSGSIFSNEPSVKRFTETFLETACTTDILREVFDLSQADAKQYADFVRQITLESLSDLGDENAAIIAEWTSRAIVLYFDVLPFPIVARVYANMCANFLFVAGYLDMGNAEDLALAYAQAIANSANVCMNSDPTSKFQALVGGYANFLRSTIEVNKTNGELVAFYFGNEWFLAAVNCGFFRKIGF